ncbi:hypothetical protein [Candidatus Bathycorpusculum sp.]|uniref:hypothetical protein n=1 Tax=Candidatus Bathycorpusculum sp. TaxID=2994959 RepID=UPI002832573B|nr:hypothetical protein [Candidatus Termitimicrobium sp.]MCL2684999.1 hypothetical protein [Candidatus Termitimicrobium sp.]
MNNSPVPYIKKNIGYNTLGFLVLITLGFYVPYFYSKFIPKINAMTQTAFGTKIKEFKTGLFAVGWGIILSPFSFVLAKALISNEGLNSTVTAILNSTNTLVLVGVIAAWLVLVFVMYGYGMGAVRGCNKQLLQLAEYYMCDEVEKILDDYGYTLENLKPLESKGIAMEKFNLAMANALIEEHNKSLLFGRD